MKEDKEKLDLDPFHPEVQARIHKFIRSMTPEEAIAFLEYRTPGVPEYWFGEPVEPTQKLKEEQLISNGRRKTKKRKADTPAE